METLTCIGCPMGCRLEVEIKETDKGPEIIDIKGYVCNRGLKYAQDEVTNPQRMLTTIIILPNASKPLSVRTSKPIPKNMIFQCLQIIHTLRPELPVRIGDCILSDLAGTGVDVIATCSLDNTFVEKQK